MLRVHKGSEEEKSHAAANLYSLLQKSETSLVVKREIVVCLLNASLKLFDALSCADIATSYRIEYLSGLLRHPVDLVDSDYLLSDDKRSAIIDMILQSPPIRSMESLWALKGITFARQSHSDKLLASPSQQTQLKIAL